LEGQGIPPNSFERQGRTEKKAVCLPINQIDGVLNGTARRLHCGLAGSAYFDTLLAAAAARRRRHTFGPRQLCQLSLQFVIFLH